MRVTCRRLSYNLSANCPLPKTHSPPDREWFDWLTEIAPSSLSLGLVAWGGSLVLVLVLGLVLVLVIVIVLDWKRISLLIACDVVVLLVEVEVSSKNVRLHVLLFKC